MFCTNCGKQIPDDANFCPYCNSKVEINPDEVVLVNPNSQPSEQQPSNMPLVAPSGAVKPQKPPKQKKPRYSNNKKPKLWASILSLVLAITMVAPLAVWAVSSINQNKYVAASDVKTDAKVETQSSGETEYETEKIEKPDFGSSSLNSLTPNSVESQKAREEIAVVETAIALAEQEIALEYPVIDADSVRYYIYAAQDAVRELYLNDQIKSYSSNGDSLRIELNAGGYYLYVPHIEGLDAGSSPELTVATYQPYYSAGQYESVSHVRDYVDDGANMISQVLDAYKFNVGGSNDTDFNDTEVDPLACANFGNHNVILWHGHGTYDSKFGPVMSLGITRTADTDSKYYSLLASGTLLYSDSTYFIGSDFVDLYIPDGVLDNTILYIGVCSGGYTNELANAFLNKGAEAVYAPSNSVLTTYNASMIRSICEGLSTQNSDGTFYSVEQALTHAQNINGTTDNGPKNATIKLFTNNPTFALDWYIDYVVAERDVVLVLDVSGSMDGTPLDETKDAAVQFVDTVLDESARIGLVTYDTSARMVCDFSTRNQYLTDNISALRTAGTTNIDAALQIAEDMLSQSKANKKIIVLMSDGIPNEARQGQDLIDYANTIKDQDIYIYTLGFFSDLDDATKAEAQNLLDEIATEGYHYEVANAEDLKFFFGDMADVISGQKYIYIRIACPVDVKVSKDGESLNSADSNLKARTSFGSLTFETVDDSGDTENTDKDDLVKILRLKDGMEYDIEISGTGSGEMDYTIQYMDANGDYTDKREFSDVPITRSTEIATVASATRSETVLNVDEDGDGRYDLLYKATANKEGEETKSPIKLILILAGIDLLWILISVLFMVLQVKKLKYLKSVA